MKLGIVADDITGSNDIGSMVAKAGYAAHIYTFSEAEDFQPEQMPDVCILDTNSRLDAAEVAYRKAFAATQILHNAGCTRFFNKTCSVFRGNIGAEFDAMLDALEREFAVVVLGFPKNGRTTANGIHYVRGVKLEDSEFRNDPIHPMRRSDLVGILAEQTSRKVDLVTYDVVQQGAETLRQHIDRIRSRCNYLILDVTDQNDLATIAAAVYDEAVLCGSSALAEELPMFWGPPVVGREVTPPPRQSDIGILCAAGSLMPQTAAQIDYLTARGAGRIVLDPQAIFDEQGREAEIQRLAAAIQGQMAAGTDVVFHSPNQVESVESTRMAGARVSWSPDAIAHGISDAMAEVTARVVGVTGQNRLLVAGGETSAAVCKRLGVKEMRVWKEIAPGLPSCITLTNAPLLLVLKSGSFGGEDFFEKALEHLKAE